ncbi:MAG: Spo0B domain-containing protein [Lachnospiraceae bacterium]|nr:Spo0B domain-containing protein [Lachnospiraceae bacterium]MBP5653875.1 Spo0B domain-containing protein [Lachnospiraceae bacterium]
MDYKIIVPVLGAVLIVILLISLLLLIRSCRKLADRNDALRESIDNLGRLNDKLRMDRHDYLNHLQIVYGLMELKEYDEMSAYMKEVYRELMKTGKAIKTSKPAVNALLAAKSAEAESKGIDFVIEVKSDLKGLKIEDWELCKVLSNLIDNGMRAVEESARTEKRIAVDIGETPAEYTFEVANNGDMIPEKLRESIFRKGFSTKKEEGHGMGLSIVCGILEANNGSIGLRSNEEETAFTVTFEKKGV